MKLYGNNHVLAVDVTEAEAMRLLLSHADGPTFTRLRIPGVALWLRPTPADNWRVYEDPESESQATRANPDA